MLVEDTVSVIIPSATPGDIANPIPSRVPVHQNRVDIYAQGLSVYASAIADTLNLWADEHGSDIRVSLRGGVHEATGMASVSVKLTDRPAPFENAALSDAVFLKLAKLAESAATRKGCLEYLRGVIVFHQDEIHIFKPVDLIGWTRTAALNDASEIYARIAQARNAGQEVAV